jgi:hypothetical protein
VALTRRALALLADGLHTARDDWRGRAARLGTACQQAACLSLIERKFNEGTTALLPFNALPGLTLGEHANGPRAHSVATQELEFEYRAPESLARWR